MPEWKTAYGDEQVAVQNEILRSTVGSGVHGIAIEGTDDHDEMGIYIEPMEHILGVGRQLEDGNFSEYRRDFTARTAGEGERSGPGDTDLIIYSLGKYLRLAMVGNPTALLPLYAPDELLIRNSALGEMLRENRDWFLSQRALHRFQRYLFAQHERMMGRGKRNRVPVRPELIEEYGWDVKYGSHALRLAHEGYEIATTGNLTLPLATEARSRVLEVKRGEVSQEVVSDEIMDIYDQIDQMLAEDKTVLPPQPNFEAISEWAIMARFTFWEREN